MNLFSKVCALAMVLAFAVAINATPPNGRGSRGLATVTGTVRDNKGTPLAGALIQLIREGAKQVIKQTYTTADGSFSARIPAGKYSLRAVAEGFSEVLFESVQVSPSAEIAYRFNLEPVGNGRTAPERRKDRDSSKWILRSRAGGRSIFQAGEGSDETVNAVRAAERAAVLGAIAQLAEGRCGATAAKNWRPHLARTAAAARSRSSRAPRRSDGRGCRSRMRTPRP